MKDEVCNPCASWDDICKPGSECVVIGACEDGNAEGSMKPKIKAILGYLERGGQRALITNPENIERALDGQTGTELLPD